MNKSNRFIIKNFLLFLFLFSIICSANTQTFQVEKVIDGDTLILNNNETVRLSGIDAPELGQPGYELSKWFLQYLTEDEIVYMEKDFPDKDDYGRSLRYLFLKKNNKMVNELMLDYGLADFRYLMPDAKYYYRLKTAVTRAEENSLGLWAFPIFPPGKIDVNNYSESLINFEEAPDYINQIISIEGVITDTYDSGKVCFLNFQKKPPRTIQLAIFSENYHLFPKNPSLYFLNKKIRVAGLIQQHKNILQIIIKSPQQITLVDTIKNN